MAINLSDFPKSDSNQLTNKKSEPDTSTDNHLKDQNKMDQSSLENKAENVVDSDQTQQSIPPKPAPKTLPPLRDDLSLHQAPFAEGLPNWTIYDPSSHRYIRIGWMEFEILSRWNLGTIELIVQSINSETTLTVSAEQVESFASFAEQACLLKAVLPQDTNRFFLRSQARKHSVANWLLHNYLFLRLRLVNPDKFLTSMQPYVAWMFNWNFIIGLALFSSVGFFLVTRQWEAFTHSLTDLFTAEGALFTALALTLSKIVHELGHGLAAKRLGCKVPSMGVAFLVLWPVLWTDVTDAWKLVRIRERLLIDASGMVAEITLASLATLAWSLLDDGALRSAVFVLASSTWILTLTVNLSPLMRFDGYFILSDSLGIPNLQERAFAYARWWMRTLFLGMKAPKPEIVSAKREYIMLVYSYSTWIYRFGLFLGIALLVYHVSFKALGFFLMGVELYYFVFGPIVRELNNWRKIAMQTGWNIKLVSTLFVTIMLVILCSIPWRAHVRAPALLKANHQMLIIPPDPGKLVFMVKQGQYVNAGDVIFKLDSVDINHDIQTLQARLNGLRNDRQGQVFDPSRRATINSSAQEADRVEAELSTAKEKQNALTIYAQFKGRIVDVPSGLQVGDFVSKRESLGYLVEQDSSVVEAFVDEWDINRLQAGAKAEFFKFDATNSLPLTLETISSVSTKTLDVAELSSQNAGPILVRKDTNPGLTNKFVPESSVYRVTFKVDGNNKTTDHRQTGVVVIDAENQSILKRTWRKMIALFVREAQV